MSKARLQSIKPKVATVDTRKGAPVAVDRIRGNTLTKIRKRVMLRDEYTCRMCGMLTSSGEIDHVVPLHLGGSESDENRQYLCVSCHLRKSSAEERDRGGSNL